MPAFPKLYQEYSDLLCRQIESFGLRNPGLLSKAETLYLGGGTPSILPADCLKQIFECLKSSGVLVDGLKEVSMEFNPESTCDETVENALNLGVRRFSLGLQTFDPELLQRIGRSHSVEAGLKALDRLISTKMQVSGDLMFDLPGQTVASFLSDVDRLSDYGLNHVSFYGLTVSPRSRLGQKVSKGTLSVDENLYEEMYLKGVELLERKGVMRYEVSNFARPGFESVHNRSYWNRGEYIGFGPGAHSYIGSDRFYAPEMYPRWRDFVCCGSPDSMLNVDHLERDDILMEFIWLSMRQKQGLDLRALEKLGVVIPESAYEKWIQKNFIKIQDGFLRLEGRGWIFMDDVVTDLANL
ncbi:MAG: coproporphyrinogen III oxidase family protein [Fibrobacter sp.]|nr:coproporphyrinogen III oxidase family protein [Fibrobacter sp.]